MGLPTMGFHLEHLFPCSTPQQKRARHDSGDYDSNPRMGSYTNNSTPEDGGSPSKSLVARASGYVSQLKSRLGKHREKSKESKRHKYDPPLTPSLCCGHKREIESFDTISGAPGVLPSVVDGHGRANSTVSASGVASSTTTNNSELYAIEDADLTPTSYHPSCSTFSGLAESSFLPGEARSEPLHDSGANHSRPSSIDANVVGVSTSTNDPASAFNQSGKTNIEGMASSTNPTFYTLNVHLQRGRHLVARDACGTSDPYVKVLIGEKLHYKSKTIYRDLNPIWDESFVLPVNDLSKHVIFKVFDYDWAFQDDFMGTAALDLQRVPHNKSQEICLPLCESLSTSKASSSNSENMGEIYINVTLNPRTIEEKEIENPETFQNRSSAEIAFGGDTMATTGEEETAETNPSSSTSSLFKRSGKWLSDSQGSTRLADSQRRLKSQIWSSVLTVLLVEAKNISGEREDKLILDAVVKFRLGNQKYKSRTVPRTTHPKWCEQFDFYLYEGQPQVLEVQLFDESFSRDSLRSFTVDIGLLDKEITHHKTYKFSDGPGEMNLLLTISGTSGTETISDLANYRQSPEEDEIIRNRYALSRSLHSLKDVGHLTVKVYEATGLVAADIGGKSDPFVVLELVNARLQTQTEYRTLNPMWNKIFTFAVKDYTSVLEVTVYDEDRGHKTEFLGKLTIPLWKIKNGEKKWYTLKDRKLVRSARGNNPQILLEMELIWNPVRGGIRAMDPPEQKFLLPDVRLKREVFLLNIERLRKIGVKIYDILQYMQSCIEWEYPVRSIIALTLYELLCYTFQPYFIPLFAALIIIKQWLVTSVTGSSTTDEISEDDPLVVDDEDDEEGEGDEKKMSLRQKLQAVQDATQTLQNALGDVASFCESTQNLFRMVIPFITWLALVGLLVLTVVLYFIPLRYLAMGWGLHKFLRPLIFPNVIPTNEAYNLIVRVPDNQQLICYRQLRVASSPEVTRNRSPPGKAPPQKKKYKFW